MAIYNEIQIGRLNRFLQKYFGIKGGPPAPQLAADIQVALNLFNGAENRYLEGWDRFAVTDSQAAVAANAGGLRLRNPAGSNVIAVFEGVWAFNTTAVVDQPALQHAAIATDLGTAIAFTTNRLDPRGRPNSSLIFSKASPAALLTTMWQLPFLANTFSAFIGTDIEEFPLLPGDAIQIVSNQVNQLIGASFLWRERFLEDGERA